MKKQQAIKLLGGTVAEAAKSVRVNSQAISNWPDELPPRLIDRVIAACVRKGIEVPPDLLEPELATADLHLSARP